MKIKLVQVQDVRGGEPIYVNVEHIVYFQAADGGTRSAYPGANTVLSLTSEVLYIAHGVEEFRHLLIYQI